MLEALIDLLAPLGINERLVRTSVFRLAREGWLKAKPIGRRAFID
jgi:phenylacetic acid degradation operon negative regulatory protein